MINQKKATIGVTLTWIVATFIIFFVIIVYLIWVGINYTGKGNSYKIEIGKETDLAETQTIYVFLNQVIENKNIKEYLFSYIDFSHSAKTPEEQSKRRDMQAKIEESMKKFLENMKEELKKGEILEIKIQGIRPAEGLDFPSFRAQNPVNIKIEDLYIEKWKKVFLILKKDSKNQILIEFWREK